MCVFKERGRGAEIKGCVRKERRGGEYNVRIGQTSASLCEVNVNLDECDAMRRRLVRFLLLPLGDTHTHANVCRAYRRRHTTTTTQSVWVLRISVRNHTKHNKSKRDRGGPVVARKKKFTGRVHENGEMFHITSSPHVHQSSPIVNPVLVWTRVETSTGQLCGVEVEGGGVGEGGGRVCGGGGGREEGSRRNSYRKRKMKVLCFLATKLRKDPANLDYQKTNF